jgi:hypothetical protein
MRKWGFIVTLFYAAAVVLLLIPTAVVLVGDWTMLADIDSHVREVYGYWLTWVCAGVFILGQVLLVVLSVDTSDRRLKPRTRIAFSIAAAGLLLAVLTFSAVSSAAVAIRGDSADDWTRTIFIGGLFVPWVLWSIAFYRYSRDTDDVVTRAVKWLLRGSVLELLIAVPSHVIVRRRHDCCAPAVTSFGIATGIAIMLLSFGPSVIFLFKKRMERLKAKGAAV